MDGLGTIVELGKAVTRLAGVPPTEWDSTRPVYIFGTLFQSRSIYEALDGPSYPLKTVKQRWQGLEDPKIQRQEVSLSQNLVNGKKLISRPILGHQSTFGFGSSKPRLLFFLFFPSPLTRVFFRRDLQGLDAV